MIDTLQVVIFNQLILKLTQNSALGINVNKRLRHRDERVNQCKSDIEALCRENNILQSSLRHAAYEWNHVVNSSKRIEVVAINETLSVELKCNVNDDQWYVFRNNFGSCTRSR